MIHRTLYVVAVLTFISALWLTGCQIPPIPQFATPSKLSLKEQEGHYIPQYQNEKGTLFFYWESGFYGILRGIYINVNGIRVGGLNRGTYFAYEADPGKVTVAAENWLYEVQTRTIKVETGERYYFRAILGFGIRGTDNPRIEMVSKSEGEPAIKKLEYATLY